MKNKKAIIAFLLALLMLVCLAAPIGAETPDGKRLTLWLGTGDFPDPVILDDFRRVNPDVTLKFITPEEDNLPEAFTAMMESGDDQVDIFLLPGFRVDSRLVFQKGYAAPLDSSDYLKAISSMMYPQIRQYVHFNDALLAVPASFYPFFWTANPGFFAQAGNKLPETLDDYLDMAIFWYGNHIDGPLDHSFDGSRSVSAQQKTALLLAVQQVFLEAESTKILTFDTPTFRSVLDKIAMLSQWRDQELQLPMTDDSAYFPKVFDIKAISPLSQHLNPDHQEECHILPPVLNKGETPVIAAMMDYFIVNPHSKNKENALHFLALYLHNTNMIRFYSLCPQEEMWVDNAAYAEWLAEEITALEQTISQTTERLKSATNLLEAKFYEKKLAHHQEELSRLEQDIHTMPAESLARYRQMVPYFDLERSADAHIFMQDPGVKRTITLFCSGSTLPEQMVGELDQHVSELFRKDQ